VFLILLKDFNQRVSDVSSGDIVGGASEDANSFDDDSLVVT
jgi:hypothetical protein